MKASAERTVRSGQAERRPVRVLYVSGGALDYGGISTVMLNYAKHFDQAAVQVDFLVHGFEPGPREEEAKALGSAVIHVPYKMPHYFANRKTILKAFSSGQYDVVHAHMDGMNGYVLGLAKRANVPVRISHCHNTQFLTTNPIRVRMHRRMANRIAHVATRLLACSEAAGRFLYGDDAVDQGKLTVVPNAIEVEHYRFDQQKRNAIRKALNLENRFVVGHIGRFDYQKNQEFLLPVLEKLRQIKPEACMVLVGDGESRTRWEQEARRMGLGDCVRLPGFCKDIPGMLSAFDAFVLPSRFEGLGIVLVEAQLSGLACIASETVPRQTWVTNCQYLSLDDPDAWAKALGAMELNEPESRMVSIKPFAQAGYDISREAEKLQRIYLESMI